MYVLHALFTEAGCWELWAEDSSRPLTLPVEPTGRETAAGRGGAARRSGAGMAQRHPFAADPAVLADLLRAAGDEVAATVRRADPRGSVPLALPSSRSGPRPSTGFARFVRDQGALGADGSGSGSGDDGSDEGEKAELRAWIVPTLALGPRDGAALLAVLDGERLATYDAEGAETDIPLADTVRYATAVAQFADALVRRGEILPDLQVDEENGDHHAVWRPTYALESAAHRKALLDAMPPVFRAQLLDAELTGRPATDVLDGAVSALVDAYVIAALTGPHGLHGESLAPPRPPNSLSVKTPIEELWLDALTSASSNLLDPERLDLTAAEALMAALDEWRTTHGATAGPVRTCFRLLAPEEGASTYGGDRADGDRGEAWTVELLLQSIEDPSLLATAHEVWHRSGAARLLRAAGADPRRDLLAGLSRAARVFPALAYALREASPTHVRLDADGAHGFLTRIAPALTGNGFGVLLPSWWSSTGRAELGFTLAAAPKAEHAEQAPKSKSEQQSEQPGRIARRSGFGLGDLVDYEWRASLGGQTLTEAEFQALADAKSNLVQFRGRWVEVDRDKLAAGLKALGSRRGGAMRVRDFLRTAVFGLDDDGLPLEAVEARGWLGDLLSGAAEQRCTAAVAPPGLHGTLRPYQERGVGWLSFMDRFGLGAVLADSMGLGKTVQVLTLLELERESGSAQGRPTLLICPMSLVANWQREAARFTPGLEVHVHHGAERLSGEQFRAAVADAHLVITTYGLALRDREELAAVDWHRVVIDEAQAIKNAGTKQARAVRAIAAPHRIALTGTPVENRLADLWSILEFANPGLLGSAESFKERFARPIERDGDERAAERLRRATGAFVLRREKTDPAIISDLPEKVEMKVVCNLTKEQASLYQATVDEMLREVAEAEGVARRGLVLALLTRLKQICNHPAHFLKDGSRLPSRSGKLARVEELCDEVLAAGEKALLFTQYAEFGGMLRAHLAERFGREVAFLHGGVPRRARDELVRRFELPDGPPLFVLSLKAGGVGLNLTAANHVIHVDRWWNPAVENQATDRAFRIGQLRDVQVRKLMCAGTLEERIDRVIEEKQDLADRIVGTGEGWLTELSVAELRDVIRLAADAVVE
ncbi:MAG TPA: DEAD/DEAH box helicase [Actinocrinis sp.]|uniref:DEAD/DEAH box helicase n=1 Tax=Actinocrinis sp. TaxID=1920516 RepID=UPI002D4316A6|nr:DEAD/DEAH box helicase [Actinocrinis sp.]HZU54941.1 DEAD/DEAH box helicase [Actinocrinis sp.]